MTFFEQCKKMAYSDPDSAAFVWRKGKTILTRSHLETCRDLNRVYCFYAAGSYRRVGILGENSYNWIMNAWGMVLAGLTTALMDPLLPADQLAQAVQLTKLEALFCSEDIMELGEEIAALVPGIKILPMMAAEGSASESIGEESMPEPISELKSGDYIYFTSGSTRRSKAVVAPFAAAEGSAESLLDVYYCRKGWPAYNPLPYHHAFGHGMLLSLYMAGCPIMLGSVNKIKQDLKIFEPELFVGVPSILKYALDKNIFPAGLKGVIVAGGVCSPKLAEQAALRGIKVQNMYGSSETAGGIAINLPDVPVDIMTPYKEFAVEVLDSGELKISSPFMFKEYYGMPDVTAQVLDGGWFMTGDLGYLDEQGCLHLQGRKKDTLILDNGEKIFCPDIDEVLSSLEGVKEGLILCADSRLAAVLHPESPETADIARKALEQYNLTQPHGRRIQECRMYYRDFPRTSSGKILRRVVEEEYPLLMDGVASSEK